MSDTLIRKVTQAITARFGRTVPRLVSKIEANIDALMAVAQREADHAVNEEAKAYKHRQRAGEHRSEAQRAERVASRLADLIH